MIVKLNNVYGQVLPTIRHSSVTGRCCVCHSPDQLYKSELEVVKQLAQARHSPRMPVPTMIAKTSASNAPASTAQAVTTLDWDAPASDTPASSSRSSITPRRGADGADNGEGVSNPRFRRSTSRHHPACGPPVHKNRQEYKSG